jgi:hypothetical protein
MKGLQQAIAVLLIGCLAGCGTLFTGTTQTVQINSVPSGATVQVNGTYRGLTPTPVTLKKGSVGQMVTLNKEGYKQKSFQPQTVFNKVGLLNFATLYLLPISWLVDSCTGALYKYDPVFYDIQLKPYRSSKE